MAIIQTINIDMIPNGIIPVINVSQYDVSGRELDFYIYKQGSPYSWVKNTTTFKLRGTKPDRTTFEVTLNKLRNEYAYIVIREDMTDVAGDVYCNVEMVENGTDRTGSQVFILRVQPDTRGEI